MSSTQTKTLETPVRKSLVGTTISDKYKIIDELDKGGMGIVYKAQDKKLQRSVALKFLPPELTRDEEARERFIHEARTASALDHNNICTIYEIGETDDEQVFISMAYYEGGSLKDKIKQGPVKYEEAVDIVIQVTKGLSKAHSHGIVHRDIKPANIMITKDNVAKILDFGLAKLAGQVRLTRTGITMGTVAYMSPEQAQGEMVDHRTDIWSLGVLLYEILTGVLPFGGENEQSMMFSIANKEPYPLKKFCPDLPEPLEHIVATILAKNPEDRYQNIDDMRDDLRSVLEDMQPTKIKARPFRSAAIKSIAVLPFQNQSQESEIEYLCDGIPQNIIKKFEQLSDIKVRAWFSTALYKGKETDPKIIGQELSADALVLGQMNKLRDQVIINVELVKVEDISRMWGDQFIEDYGEIFIKILDIQEGISNSIIGHLNLKLTKQEEQQIAKRPTADDEAYDMYLRAQHFINKWTPEGFQKGEEFLKKAIEKDHEFALAHAHLAYHYNWTAVGGYAPHEILYPIAKSSIEKALELDPKLAEGRAFSAAIKFFLEWDWKEAEKEFKYALELNPNNAAVIREYAIYLTSMLRYEEAILSVKRAFELDPHNPLSYLEVGWHSIFAGQYDGAISQFKKLIELHPDYAWAYLELAWAYGLKGQEKEALAACQKAEEKYPDPGIEHDPWPFASLGFVYGYSGNKERAEETIEKLHELAKQRYVDPFNFAWVYTGLEEFDKALDWYKKAYEVRSPQMTYFNIVHSLPDRIKSNMSSHPRYLAIMEKMGF